MPVGRRGTGGALAYLTRALEIQGFSWQTGSGANLFGVRFGELTAYLNIISLECYDIAPLAFWARGTGT